MKFEKDTLYVWVGGSCDYGHKERAGGGAYIAETYESPSSPVIVDTFTCAQFDSTEFKMIFAAMDHALAKFPDRQIVFLSNVQYILNYPAKQNVALRILPFHKFPRQKQVHDMASEAMRQLRLHP